MRILYRGTGKCGYTVFEKRNQKLKVEITIWIAGFPTGFRTVGQLGYRPLDLEFSFGIFSVILTLLDKNGWDGFHLVR